MEELGFVSLRSTVVPELYICIASSEQNSIYDGLEQNISVGRDLNNLPVQLPTLQPLPCPAHYGPAHPIAGQLVQKDDMKDSIKGLKKST